MIHVMKLWFMILIKCQIRSKYEWLRNSTPEKVFREFSPLIVLVCPPKCQDIYSLWTKCNLRARACPPVSGVTPPTTPAPSSGGGAPPRTTWAWGPGAGTSRLPRYRQSRVKHHAALVAALWRCDGKRCHWKWWGGQWQYLLWSNWWEQWRLSWYELRK